MKSLLVIIDFPSNWMPDSICESGNCLTIRAGYFLLIGLVLESFKLYFVSKERGKKDAHQVIY